MQKKKQHSGDMLRAMLGTDDESSNAPATLAIESLVHFPEHKFKLYEGEQLSDMVASVKEFGILLPLIVWKQENETYTILSGHNRYESAKLAGLSEVPVLIKEDLTMEEATLIVTETNLRQRSFNDLSHSERAFSLAQHYEAMKKQGKRTDILDEISKLLNTPSTSPHNGAKLRSDEKIGKNYGLSKNTVCRYIKLASLVTPLLELIDEGKLGVTPAYPLSFIDNKLLQNELAEQIERGEKIDVKKAERLRKTYEEGTLTEEVIQDVLTGKQVIQEPKGKKMAIPKKIFSTYFKPEQTIEEIEEILEKALASYFEMKGECP